MLQTLWRLFFLVAVSVSASKAQCLTDDDNVRGIDITLFNRTPFVHHALRLAKALILGEPTLSNSIISPYSVWNALTLAYSGAGSNSRTEAQLKRALGHTNKAQAMEIMRQYIQDLASRSQKGFTVDVGNRAFFDLNAVPVRNCMLTALNEEIQEIDFSRPQQAALEINNWVDSATKGLIPKLVDEMALSRAVMVLANAAYFKGIWLTQFNPSSTTNQTFYTSKNDNLKSTVEMMYVSSQFRLGNSEELNAQVLELPYEGNDLSMYIFLPPLEDGVSGLRNIVTKLTPEIFRNTIKTLSRTLVDVYLPKFKIEKTYGDELITGIRKMGITDVFDEGRADLTGFSKSSGLAISGAVHKAFVEVNEEGTEAAAATGFILTRISTVRKEVFKANRPFLYVIHDNIRDNMLFIGTFVVPEGSSKS